MFPMNLAARRPRWHILIIAPPSCQCQVNYGNVTTLTHVNYHDEGDHIQAVYRHRNITPEIGSSRFFSESRHLLGTELNTRQHQHPLKLGLLFLFIGSVEEVLSEQALGAIMQLLWSGKGPAYAHDRMAVGTLDPAKTSVLHTEASVSLTHIVYYSKHLT
ncbi:hypothetical protein ACMFMG_000804 [Clarireedia jacksonii]